MVPGDRGLLRWVGISAGAAVQSRVVSWHVVTSSPVLLSHSLGAAAAPPAASTGAALLPLASADGTHSDPSAIFASHSLFSCSSKSMTSLQGFIILMAVLSPMEAEANISRPARSQAFRSRASPSDTFNSWLSHHVSRTSRACSSCFITLFLKKESPYLQ